MICCSSCPYQRFNKGGIIRTHSYY
jgi:hypothetical protein